MCCRSWWKRPVTGRSRTGVTQPEAAERVLVEKAAHEELRHPFMLSLVSAFQDATSHYFLLELAEATLAADHGDALAEPAAELHRMRLRALLELLRPAKLRASREGAHALEELKAFEGARLTAATHLRTLNAHEVLATLAEEFHDTRTLAELCARQRLVPWAVALERRLLSGEAAQAGGDAGGGTSPPL